MSTGLPVRDQFPEIAALIDVLPVPALVRAAGTLVVQTNLAFRSHTGLSAADDGLLAVHPDDRDAVAAHLAATGSAEAGEIRIRDRRGGYQRFLAAPAITAQSAGRPCAVLMLSAQPPAPPSGVPGAGPLALRDAMLDAIPERVELIGADGRLLHVNRAGRIAHVLAGTDAPGAWLDGLPATIRRRGGKALGEARQGRRARFRVVTGAAGTKPRHWENTLVPMSDDSGATVAVVNVVRDVTAQREAEERIRTADRVDRLTRVWNRREFKERLQGSIARASGENGAVGVMLADIDHFKHVNEMFGDPAGDHLLRVLSDRIKSVVPPGAYVARLGGDEFAIAIPGLRDEAQLLAVAESVLRQVEAPVMFQGKSLKGALSIGCAMYPRDAADMSALLKSADAALNDLKDGGRGRAQVFKQRMLDDVTVVAEQLRTAWDVVRRNIIVPFYQAKVRLDDCRIVGLEALLRWRDQDGTLRYPGQITEAFSNFDLATRIADAMQEKVLADIAAWIRAGVRVVPVAINAAPVEFLRGDYAERLLGRLAHFGVPAGLIEVEVTEHSLSARSATEVAHALRTLRAAGVRIALDDFGAGHSSLVHLRDYSINVIKLDRNFVAGMMVDPAMAAIVETICALAPRLGLEVVAEGVETEAQSELLQPWGCRVAQGFLFGEALSADLIVARLGPLSEA